MAMPLTTLLGTRSRMRRPVVMVSRATRESGADGRLDDGFAGFPVAAHESRPRRRGSRSRGDLRCPGVPVAVARPSGASPGTFARGRNRSRFFPLEAALESCWGPGVATGAASRRPPGWTGASPGRRWGSGFDWTARASASSMPSPEQTTAKRPVDISASGTTGEAADVLPAETLDLEGVHRAAGRGSCRCAGRWPWRWPLGFFSELLTGPRDRRAVAPVTRLIQAQVIPTVDMDAFYVAVELLRGGILQGKPVIVARGSENRALRGCDDRLRGAEVRCPIPRHHRPPPLPRPDPGPQ